MKAVTPENKNSLKFVAYDGRKLVTKISEAVNQWNVQSFEAWKNVTVLKYGENMKTKER